MKIVHINLRENEMIKLFIDSNIWLSLYSFTKDDLQEFDKLYDLLGKEIELLITQQVYDEVLRNRETKIHESLSKFVFPAMQFPAFCKNYENYDAFKTTYDNARNMYNEWLKQIKTDIQRATTPADEILKKFFTTVNIVPCDDQLVALAYDRYKRGNPPGKDNKYGDAINWECLLSAVPESEDLYFLGVDKDYRSILEKSNFSTYLLSEWRKKKKSEIHYYSSLMDFLRDHFKNIRLKNEQEKDELIQGLQSSPNFATTHSIIDKLYQYTDWTDEQIDALCSAVINNKQVEWILGDIDVLQFYSTLLSKIKYESLNEGNVKQVFEQIFIIENEEDKKAEYAADTVKEHDEYYN